MITEPGVYDITIDEYHADPVEGHSLSSSGARKLLDPSCPALFRHEQLNPPAPKATFDLGHAAHKLVLGAGPELVEVEDEWGADPNAWRTNNVKAVIQEVRERGAIPLKPEDYSRVQAMADKLREHPIAAALLNAETGRPEQTLVWRDKRTGVWRRALLDWLPNAAPLNGRMLVVDYKTTISAHPTAIQKTIHSYGYHQQADWYLDGVETLGLAAAPKFLFIFQEKTAPYLVTVAEPDTIALRVGRERNREAIGLYAECVSADRWPAYSDDIELIPLPAWVENNYLRETA